MPPRSLPRPSKKSKAQPRYDTYEDAMEGGVEHEEKGERFRIGDKAQRFYERSLELYQTASRYQTTYDSLYNTARVMYILSTSFYLPPTSLTLLSQSILTYRSAINLLSTTSASTSTSTSNPSFALLLDAQFNLAQAILDQAEMLEDFQALAGPQADPVSLRSEALGLLMDVAKGQTAWVDSRSAEQPGEDGEAVPVVSATSGAGGMDVDSEDGDDEGSDAAYETHEPTPYALAETLLLVVDTVMSLWDAPGESTPPSPSDLAMLEELLARVRALQVAVPSAEIEAEIAAVEVALDLGQRNETAAGAQASVDCAAALMGRLKAVQASGGYPSLDAVIKSKLVGVLLEVLSWKAKLETTSGLLPAAWSTLSLATTTATTSVDLPITALDAPLFKASVFLDLSNLSLRRAILQGHPAAEKNRPQLMANVETYANRALDALGWGYYQSTTSSTSSGLMAPKIPHQGGWEREHLGRKCLYRLAQAIVKSSREFGLDATAGAGEQKIRAWAQKVAGLNALRERRLTGEDIGRIVEEDGEEGIVQGEVERGFWAEYVASLG